MARWHRLGATIAIAAALVSSSADPWSPESVGAQDRAASTTSWPGDGRFLTAPQVVGDNVVGQGALRIENGVVTNKLSNFDDAPPVLTLDAFALVDHGATGLTAMFRFLHPIVQLHEWRRVPVRHTISVLLTAPDGAVHEVQLQADGSTAFGDVTAGTFTPTGVSTSAVAGTVALVDIPASLGVTADWTVQGIVRVEADGRIHPHSQLNFDTGYLAGTSIVPVSLLTGGTPTTPVAAVLAGALITLTGGAYGEPGEVPDSIRPVAMHFEGEGADLAVVVELAAPPAYDLQNLQRLDLQLGRPGTDPLAEPMVVSWAAEPDGSPLRAGTVQVGNSRGTVPVTVSGTEVRFAFGQFQPDPPIVDTTSASVDDLALDQVDGTMDVVLSRDETVSSADGASRYVFAETFADQPTYPAPAKQSDNATITLSGGVITVQRASSGSIATGAIDSIGEFFASNATELYTGEVDQYGNAFIYDASVGPGPDGAVTNLPSVAATSDAASLAAVFTVPILIGVTTSKGQLDNPPVLTPHAATAPPDASWITRITAAGVGDAPPTLDWPAWPLAIAPAPTSGGLQDPTGPFIIRVSANANDGPTGIVSFVTGPWISSDHVEALPTPAPATVDATSANSSTSPAAIDATPPPAASAVASATDVSASADSAAPAASGSDSSSSFPWLVVVLAVVLVGAVVAASRVTRRRRRPPPVPPTSASLRSVRGSAQHSAAPRDGGHDLGVQSSPGGVEYAVHESIGAP